MKDERHFGEPKRDEEDGNKEMGVKIMIFWRENEFKIGEKLMTPTIKVQKSTIWIIRSKKSENSLHHALIHLLLLGLMFW